MTSLPNFLPSQLLEIMPHFVAKIQLPFAIDLRGGSRLVVRVDKQADVSNESNGRDGVIKVIEKRLESAGAAFAHYRITRQGRDQIRIEVPSLFDVDLLKGLVTLEARLEIYKPYQGIKVEDILAGRIDLPHNAQIFYDHQGDPPLGHLVYTKPLMTSENVESIHLHERLYLDIFPSVAFSCAAENCKNLIAVLDGEAIAIAYDNGGDGLRLKLDSQDFAENLALVLNSGSLPSPTHVLEERTIGADMGDEFSSAGVRAVLGALLVIFIFIIVCYGALGIIATFALWVNLALLISILSISGLSLSLAGFAGLVLTVGVCVDALILIYERMREEYRHGVSLSEAIDAGFSRARRTIIDANITTLLGAVMLFLFGVGPISGFAMTVTIGLMSSLFTSLIVMRPLLYFWLHYCRPKNKKAGLLQFLPSRTAIPFMRLRKLCLGLAAGISCLTIVLYTSFGIHYGIDFVGGSLAVLTPYNGNVQDTDILNRANELNIGVVSLQKSDDERSAYLTIPSQIMGENADQTVAFKLRGEFDADYQLERMDVVGPTLAHSLSYVSLWAVCLSLAAIFFYVWFRFNWKFGLGALIATVYDVIILSLIFIVTGWEFNLWSIAALLAVIGYSLNDTIVVYDRIRGFLNDGREMITAQWVDLGINRTLSRTILTSLATLLAHIPLYYYGGTDMRNFASILLIGIFIGTISSIFIAGPLLVVLKVGKRHEKRDNHG